jgi:phage head maturation protease
MAGKNHENTKTATIGAFSRRAMVESYNDEARTFTVSFASEMPVLMQSFWSDDYYEVLKMEGMRTARLDAGAPLLDNHDRDGSVAKNVIGVVERHWIEGGKAYASVKMSDRPELEGLRGDIKNGIIRNVSCGYRVFEFTEKPRAEGETVPTFIATDWEVFEVSLVSVPADHTVGVRSDNSEKNTLTIKRAVMDENKTVEAVEPQAKPPIDLDGERKLAIESERKRALAIHQTVAKLKLGDDFARALIEEGVSFETAQTRAIEKWTEQDPAKGVTATVSVGTDGADNYRAMATGAMLARSGAVKQTDLSEIEREGARNYRGLSLLELSKRSLDNLGISYAGMDKMEIAHRAITSSTSDLPVILEGTMRRVLLNNYQAASDTWSRFCMTGSVGDFRDHKRLRMGTFSRLEKVAENAEYRNKAIPDAEFETVSADTYGNTINLSRQMIVNDDLGAFVRLSQMLGRAAARSIEIDVYALLALNGGLGPVLEDGLTMFHANHANIATAAAPSVDAFDAMRVLMASQKDPSGNDFLDLRPSVGLFPIAIGGNAKVVNDAQYDTDTAGKFQKPNKVRGLLSDIVDTPRIVGNRYYMFAGVMEDPCIEVAFLDGVQTPYTESRMGFEVDGMEWKIRMDYGVAGIGFRGAVTNAGA